MASYTITRKKNDGSYDLIECEILSENEDGTPNEINEKLVGNITDPQYPNGKESDDIVAQRNRVFRNDYLQETDWWACSDVTMTEAQRSYRQALRDITKHTNWPNLQHDDWPPKPSE